MKSKRRRWWEKRRGMEGEHGKKGVWEDLHLHLQLAGWKRETKLYLCRSYVGTLNTTQLNSLYYSLEKKKSEWIHQLLYSSSLLKQMSKFIHSCVLFMKNNRFFRFIKQNRCFQFIF